MDVNALAKTTMDAIQVYGLKVVGGVLLLIGGWVAAGWIATKVRNWAKGNSRIDDTIGAFLAKIARIGVLVFTVIAVLNAFGVQTASLIALLGALGLAVGLALQGTMGNVASGVVLLILRPISVGQVVDIGGTIGTVKDIGLFSTQLDTPQGVRVILPNSAVASGTVRNLSTNPNRRVDLVFGIGYGDDIDKALAILKDVIASDPRVLQDPAPSFGVMTLGDSSVDLFCRPWVKGADFWAVTTETTKTVKQRFDAEGVSIPFPQRDVHLHQVA